MSIRGSSTCQEDNLAHMTESQMRFELRGESSSCWIQKGGKSENIAMNDGFEKGYVARSYQSVPSRSLEAEAKIASLWFELSL